MPQASTLSQRVHCPPNEIRSAREGKQDRSVILAGNPEANAVGPPWLKEGTSPHLKPAHQGQQNYFTSDVLKRNTFLLKMKATRLVPRQVAWSLNRGRDRGAQKESSRWQGTSLQSRLSRAADYALGERKTRQKACSLFGDFSTLQPLQDLLQKIQFLSLHLSNNKVCVGKSGVRPLPEGTFHTKYSPKHWLFTQTRPVLSHPWKGYQAAGASLLLSQQTCQSPLWKLIQAPLVPLMRSSVQTLSPLLSEILLLIFSAKVLVASLYQAVLVQISHCTSNRAFLTLASLFSAVFILHELLAC